MTKTMISIKNLSKAYRMGTVGSGSFRDDFTIWWANLHGKENPLLRVGESTERIESEYLWALRNINLEIKEGEILGIIGENGAGKSTLLKILSRITSPSDGEFHLGGRLSSLIEVGTGFHSELTGRENIYLNGAIHGMSRSEIGLRLDEIIDFAGVGKYIDTPVKRYSSGMYVRLGFAVAAHLNSEIMLIDEVLAVGDAAFQKKALGKISDISGKGRTILFVSHNLSSIVSICNRCIWIEMGKLVDYGLASTVTQKYLEKTAPPVNIETDLEKITHYGNGNARFTALEIYPLTEEGQRCVIIQTGNDLEVETTLMAYEEVLEAIVAIIIYDSNGYRIIDANTGLNDHYLNLKPGQKAKVKFRLFNLLLKPDTYRIGLWIGRPNVYDIDGITYAKEFIVEFDPKSIRSGIKYPGTYQCHFSDQIEIS